MVYRIYISSTYRDLIEDRKKLREVFDRTKFETVCMEKYPYATSKNIKTMIENDVRSCHIYVCIIGDRYGSLAKDDKGNILDFSYTEAEYDAALSVGIPKLVFIKTNLGSAEEKLKNFINKVHHSPISPTEYEDPKDLRFMALSSVVAETRTNERNLLPMEIKYFCDRRPHAGAFRAALFNHPEQQLHFFLIKGHIKNGHGMFIDRCTIDIKKMFPPGKVETIECEVACYPPLNEAQLVSFIQKDIVWQLEERTAQYGLAFTADSIFECIEKGWGKTCLILSISIKSLDLLNHCELFTRALEQLYQRFPKSSNPSFQQKKIIFLTHILYEGVDAGEEAVIKEFEEYGQFPELCLPELNNITKGIIIDWLKTTKIEDNRSRIDQLYTEFFSGLPKSNGDEFFMDDTEASLEKVIDLYNKTKN